MKHPCLESPWKLKVCRILLKTKFPFVHFVSFFLLFQIHVTSGKINYNSLPTFFPFPVWECEIYFVIQLTLFLWILKTYIPYKYQKNKINIQANLWIKTTSGNVQKWFLFTGGLCSGDKEWTIDFLVSVFWYPTLSFPYF